ncbi:hypothetical protein FOZ63_025024, partial [Perkinsus olseni]
PEAVNYIRNGPKIPTSLQLRKFIDDLYTGGTDKVGITTAHTFATFVMTGHGLAVDPLKSFSSWPTTEEDHNDEANRSTLGYKFNPKTDEFFVVYSGKLESTLKTTKRQCCAALASLYDPLGLLVELDIEGRKIWRAICEVCKDWKALVPPRLVNK